MPKRLYTLEVTILDGLMTEEFVRDNPTVSRTIEICGDQTLQYLHAAIFDAFDREDEHMYEFQFGEEPHDLDGDRYGGHSPDEAPFILGVSLEPSFSLSVADEPVGNVADATIGDLELTGGRTFWYWFDFGDDWYHQIDVVEIGEANPEVAYPRVVARIGESPPQYELLEDEE